MLYKKIILINKSAITLIAGPCAIESEEHALKMAFALKDIAEEHKIQLIYKSSFDKANRTSINSNRGIGIEKGLEVLKKVKDETSLPIVTDVHCVTQIQAVAAIVDIIQIPAFLCRQTDLILAAAKTQKTLLIKKGQFIDPWEMQDVVEKAHSVGNYEIALCERGNCFGYGNLVVDMRSLDIMKNMDVPVVFDATHSAKFTMPASGKDYSQKKFIPTLACAAAATGIAGLFLEVHDNPNDAVSDGAYMLNLKDLPSLLKRVIAIDNVVKS